MSTDPEAMDPDCSPATDPSDSKSCTLPSGGWNPGSPPNLVTMDKAINERYGKPTEQFVGMKFTGDDCKSTNGQTCF